MFSQMICSVSKQGLLVLEENSQLGFGKEIPRVNSSGGEIKQKAKSLKLSQDVLLSNTKRKRNADPTVCALPQELTEVSPSFPPPSSHSTGGPPVSERSLLFPSLLPRLDRVYVECVK